MVLRLHPLMTTVPACVPRVSLAVLAALGMTMNSASAIETVYKSYNAFGKVSYSDQPQTGAWRVEPLDLGPSRVYPPAPERPVLSLTRDCESLVMEALSVLGDLCSVLRPNGDEVTAQDQMFYGATGSL